MEQLATCDSGDTREAQSEPAWVSRFAKGNADISPFVAKDIASQVRELLIYRRAIESMAAQLACSKKNPLELARQILSQKTGQRDLQRGAAASVDEIIVGIQNLAQGNKIEIRNLTGEEI